MAPLRTHWTCLLSLSAHCMGRCTTTHASAPGALITVALQVETAYDVLLMQSMKRRIGGAVDSSVRFADVTKARPAQQVQPLSFALAQVISTGCCACHSVPTCISLEAQPCCGPLPWLQNGHSGHACQACPAVWCRDGPTAAEASNGISKSPCAHVRPCPQIWRLHPASRPLGHPLRGCWCGRHSPTPCSNSSTTPLPPSRPWSGSLLPSASSRCSP